MIVFFELKRRMARALCSRSEALARFDGRGGRSALPNAKAFGMLFSGTPKGARLPRKGSGAQGSKRLARLPKLKSFGAFVLSICLLPCAASAQQVLTLKSAASDGDGRITVADVFDNSGAMGGVVLGYRSGATAILDAATVQSIVGANGGYWANPRGQRRIMVTAGPDGSASTAPMAPRDPFPVAAPPAAVMPAAAIPAAMQPTAPINPVAASPIVVKRSEIVSVTWSQGGLSLTMDGVAQKDAAAGDLIPIQNPTSKKIIDAVVTGPGEAIAGLAADRFRARMQLSSR